MFVMTFTRSMRAPAMTAATFDTLPVVNFSTTPASVPTAVNMARTATPLDMIQSMTACMWFLFLVRVLHQPEEPGERDSDDSDHGRRGLHDPQHGGDQSGR